MFTLFFKKETIILLLIILIKLYQIRINIVHVSISEINTRCTIEIVKEICFICVTKKILFGPFFVLVKKNDNFGQQHLSLEFTDCYNTDCWLGLRNSSGWRRMFWWRNVLGLLVDHGLTRASPLLLQRLRTHSWSDMKKTGFWCGVSSLTLVRMLKRYFSLEHSSIASSKRAELGFSEVFKVSISAETVWIWSSWKTKQSCTEK